MQQDWTQKKERGSVIALKMIVWIATTLNRRISRLFLYPISLYFMLTAADSRRASAAYLTKVLPHAPRKRDVFRHFHCFASVLLDRVFFLLGRTELFDIRVVDDDYAAQDTAVRGRGVFMMGAHMGSFEAVRMVSRKHESLKLVLLMYEQNAKKIGALMAAINPKAQQEIVPLGNLNAMLIVRDRLAQGAIVGILADRTLSDEKGLELEFLGTQTTFPTGPFRMAAMMRKPVYLMVGLYRGKNRYDIHLEQIADFSESRATDNRTPEQAVEAAIRHYAERLEYFARIAPYNWFNFYDFWQGNQ